jgi:hypothetical protein
MVGGHLFGLLALVLHLSGTQFGSGCGSRERRAIMGYRDMQIYLPPLDLFLFIRITTLRNRNTTTHHLVRIR